jgi:hypothetical protein
MSANQKQHYLPKSYQRGWTNTADNLLTVYHWKHDKLVVERKSPKATGAIPGLYFMPMALPKWRNLLEDKFWSRVDQCGADGLRLLKSSDPDAEAKLDKRGFITFLLSLILRNPIEVGEIKRRAIEHLRSGCLSTDYAANRSAHWPETFEEFSALLDADGLPEHAAQVLISQVMNSEVQAHLLTMDWQVVTLNNSVPLITSDVPSIRFKGLKRDDGMLILPLSPTEFFVAYNRGAINMKNLIDESILTGQFVESMNKFVVRRKHKTVYAFDDSQTDFIARYFSVKEEPYSGVFQCD